MVLFLCERPQMDLPSPNCLATATAPAKNLSFTYRFKRALLSNWRQIADGANALIARLRN